MSFNYDVISDLLREGYSFDAILEAYGLVNSREMIDWIKYRPKVETKPDPLSEVSFF